MVKSFQNIPIGKVLQKLYANTDFKAWLHKERVSTDQTIRSFSDGKVFSQYLLCSCECKALQLQLYFDEVEVANPLGSKTKIHDLEIFYYTFQNLPNKFNSSLSSFFFFLHCPLFREGCGGSSSRLSHHTLRSSITSIISLGRSPKRFHPRSSM